MNKVNNLEIFIDKFFVVPVILAWYEVKSKYYRSTIGPFWITLSTLVTITGLSFVFWSIFNIPLKTTIPWISCGIIVWVYVSNVIDESTGLLIDGSLLSFNVTLFDIVLRHTYKNLIIFSHNIVLLIPVGYIFKVEINLNLLTSIYGLVLLFINSITFSIIFGLLCLRYRDFISIIKSFLYLLFLMTPIFWMPSVLSKNRSVLVDVNPLFQIIQTIRAPFFGNNIGMSGFLFTLIFTFVFIIIAFICYKKYSKMFRIWI